MLSFAEIGKGYIWKKMPLGLVWLASQNPELGWVRVGAGP